MKRWSSGPRLAGLEARTLGEASRGHWTEQGAIRLSCGKLGRKYWL